jgi:hypothetical protein
MIRIGTALLFVAASWTTATACSCAPLPPTIKTYRELAEWKVNRTPVILEGKIESLKVSGWPFQPVAGETVSAIPRVSATFSAVQVYRGQTPTEVVVETGVGGGDCGFEFNKGESYLVFASKEDSGHLSTGICSGTRLLRDADTELRLLRGEPASSADIAARGRGTEDLAASGHPQTHQVCGKISRPMGIKASSISVIFWPAGQEETALFHYLTADAEMDGSYCMDYLDPGKYLIGAIQSPRKHAGTRYVSYYPGVGERSQAMVIVVEAKAQTVRADFPLLAQPLFKVHGYLRGAPENLAEAIMVVLTSAVPDHFHMSEPVELGPHGVFEFEGVPSGHYTAFAITQGDGQSFTFLSSGLEIDVTEDVGGLKLDYVARKQHH